MHILRTAAVSLLLFSTIGCNTFPGNANTPTEPSERSLGSLFEKMPLIGRGKKEETPYPNPVKLAATWTPDVLVQTGRTPTRGFGGRLFFYDERSKSVPVEGTLVVHGFDDMAPSPDEQMKRFVFTPEQFTRHFSQSDIGASYSVWIPWDAAGGVQRNISLVATFESSSGKVVQGVPTSVLLPGRTPDAEERLAKRLSPQYRKWQIASKGSNTDQGSGLTTTTIARRRPNRSSGRGRGGETSTMTNGRVMMAGARTTPSQDIPSNRTTRAVNTLPASARLPKIR